MSKRLPWVESNVFQFRAIVGLDGGAYPVVGMPIEHPRSFADYVVVRVEPTADTPYRIDSNWWPAVDESISLHPEQIIVTCRPALEGEVKAWMDKEAAAHLERVRLYESLRKPSWKRWLGLA